jgi:hypothetical protein
MSPEADRDGKANLNVMTSHRVETHRIGRNRERRERKPNNQRSTSVAAPSSGVLDDEIPFATESR